MKKVCLFFLASILSLSCVLSAKAQLLDGDDFSVIQEGTDNSDALFEEMFNDFPETEKDITKVKTFDDAVDALSKEIKKNTPIDDEVPASYLNTPLQGTMYVGIQKNSFKIFKDISGQSRCSFTVGLKSDLEKDIRLLALNLVYSQKVFAFVFKNVPAKKNQYRRINSSGDICYKMAGVVPDINVHKCKIKATIANDCYQHIKWSDDLE